MKLTILGTGNRKNTMNFRALISDAMLSASLNTLSMYLERSHNKKVMPMCSNSK